MRFTQSLRFSLITVLRRFCKQQIKSAQGQILPPARLDPRTYGFTKPSKEPSSQPVPRYSSPRARMMSALALGKEG
jgi:hypothetical protein